VLSAEAEPAFSATSFGSSCQSSSALKEFLVLIDGLDAAALIDTAGFRAGPLVIPTDLGLTDTAPVRSALHRLCAKVLLLRPIDSARQSGLQRKRELAICGDGTAPAFGTGTGNRPLWPRDRCRS
jgi:hypothetical protein